LVATLESGHGLGEKCQDYQREFGNALCPSACIEKLVASALAAIDEAAP
jgi:hypothetical protein